MGVGKFGGDEDEGTRTFECEGKSLDDDNGLDDERTGIT